MINNFDYCKKTRFIFGKDVEKSIGKDVKAMGCSTVLVHHDSGKFLYDSGLLDAIKGYLADAGLRVVELGGVMPNPRLSKVYEGIELCRRENVDCIVAIGGGSASDSAKAIAGGFYYDGDIWDCYAHVGKHVEKALPVCLVLTYPATGTEASGGGVILNEETGDKRPYGAPNGCQHITNAYMNPELTYSLPPYLTACGIADMYAHTLERYFAPDTDFGMMDRLAEAIMRNLLVYGPKVLAEPTNYLYRAEIMWNGTVAHNDSCGHGRIQDWGSHYIGHEMSALYDTAHGATLSIIFPAWMKYVYKKALPRFVRYAVEVFGVENDPSNPEWVAEEGIRLTEDFFRRMGLPTSFTEGGIPMDKFDVIAKKAPVSQGDDHIGGLIPLYEKECMEILELAR